VKQILEQLCIFLIKIQHGNITLNNGCIEFEVIAVNHHKDIEAPSAPTLTLISKNIIMTKEVDAREPNNNTDNRQTYGNNRWSVSNIRQWLNSSGAANKWFTPQHAYDTAPTYVNNPGFLSGFSNKVTSHFATVKNITEVSKCDKTLDGITYDETNDKIFLLSYREMFSSGTSGSLLDGTWIKYFSSNAKRVKYFNGTATNYWLRSGLISSGFRSLYIMTSGRCF
jgi:hypothetical protein